MYLPWTCAGENGHTPYTASQRQVHWQAIARDKTPMALNIGQMLEQRWPSRQYINLEPFLPQFPCQLIIIRPLFHCPNRTRCRGNSNISVQTRRSNGPKVVCRAREGERR